MTLATNRVRPVPARAPLAVAMDVAQSQPGLRSECQACIVPRSFRALYTAFCGSISDKFPDGFDRCKHNVHSQVDEIDSGDRDDNFPGYHSTFINDTIQHFR